MRWCSGSLGAVQMPERRSGAAALIRSAAGRCLLLRRTALLGRRSAGCGISCVSDKALFRGTLPNAPSLIFGLAFQVEKPLTIRLRFLAGGQCYNNALGSSQPLRDQDFDQSLPSNL